MKTEDIFSIIKEHPGVTGFQIWAKMTEQSRVARWFGQDSFWASLLGPNPGSIYVHLARLEAAKRITSEWGIATAARGGHRPRHYYVAECDDDRAADGNTYRYHATGLPAGGDKA